MVDLLTLAAGTCPCLRNYKLKKGKMAKVSFKAFCIAVLSIVGGV